MNKQLQVLPYLAFCLALSVIAFAAWQKGVVQIQTNSIYQCTFNGLQQSTQGTIVKINLRSTHITWTQCGKNKMMDV